MCCVCTSLNSCHCKSISRCYSEVGAVIAGSDRWRAGQGREGGWVPLPPLHQIRCLIPFPVVLNGGDAHSREQLHIFVQFLVCRCKIGSRMSM